MRGNSARIASGYFCAAPVLKITTCSSRLDPVSRRTAARAPRCRRPSRGRSPALRCACPAPSTRASATSPTATARPPLARTASRIMKSPTAAGTRMPLAIVAAPANGSANRSPRSKARTIGAQPSDCTATIRGRLVVGQPAERGQLVKGLPHADQPGAAAGGIENHVGQPPIELLGQLQAHRLLAFDPVRLLERRDVEPAQPLLAFAHDLAAVGDQPRHQKRLGAGQVAFVLVDGRRVVGHEDEGLDAGPRGVGRHRPAGVAGRGNRQPARCRTAWPS